MDGTEVVTYLVDMFVGFDEVYRELTQGRHSRVTEGIRYTSLLHPGAGHLQSTLEMVTVEPFINDHLLFVTNTAI